MTRRRKPRDHAREQERIETILALGYFAMQFCDTRWRIQDRIDFWPSTGKWADRGATAAAQRAMQVGEGFPALIAYLAANVSTGEKETA